jgi:hypothetical protein
MARGVWVEVVRDGYCVEADAFGVWKRAALFYDVAAKRARVEVGGIEIGPNVPVKIVQRLRDADTGNAVASLHSCLLLSGYGRVKSEIEGQPRDKPSTSQEKRP